MKRKITCNHCEYEWETESDMEYVTCPSCQKKTKKIIIKDKRKSK